MLTAQQLRDIGATYCPRCSMLKSCSGPCTQVFRCLGLRACRLGQGFLLGSHRLTAELLG
jgi:hypothetical protein